MNNNIEIKNETKTKVTKQNQKNQSEKKNTEIKKKKLT